MNKTLFGIKSVLLFFIAAISLSLTGCKTLTNHCPSSPVIKGLVNSTKLLKDLQTLSASEMQGRKVGSAGSLAAQKFIISRFKQIGLKTFSHNYRENFNYPANSKQQATNIVGWLPGTDSPDNYIVISAHYDHLGMTGRKIFHGADDNASGVSGMLALAEYLTQHPHRNSVIFVATDAEEPGLFGAKAFVNSPPVKIEKIKLNINLDMIARGERKNRLYIAGTHNNQRLKQIVINTQNHAGICLKRGHDGKRRTMRSSIQTTNWANASDHAAFAKKNIPYIYFGVDLHRDYHKSTDTFDNIQPEFFIAAVETIVQTFNQLEHVFLSQ